MQKIYVVLKTVIFVVFKLSRIGNFWAWADKIWGIFGQFISTHFGTVSPLSMFSINQPLFLQKTKLLYPNPKYLFGLQRIMDVAIIRP